MADWSWQVSVETALKTLNERKRVLETDSEALRSTVKSSFDLLRRHLDEQEARLLSGVEEQAQSSRRQIEDSEANISSLRVRLSEGADAMNRAVATGDINGVVHHGKRLEDASAQLREAEAIVAAMDTSIGGTLPIEAAENGIKNLVISGSRAPGLGGLGGLGSSYAPSQSYGAPASYTSAPVPAYTPTPALRPTASTPAAGETVPNAIYVNGVPHDATEADVRYAFERFGEIKMVNARHINTGGFAFVFFNADIGAQIALENPRVVINGKTANVLAKKQILAGGS